LRQIGDSEHLIALEYFQVSSLDARSSDESPQEPERRVWITLGPPVLGREILCTYIQVLVIIAHGQSEGKNDQEVRRFDEIRDLECGGLTMNLG